MPIQPLPQTSGDLFLSDGGLETTLVFIDGIDLPHFAAFVLLADDAGRQRLSRYYKPYLELCAEVPGAGFVLETPTWRANPDWAALLGYDAARLRESNIAAARMMVAMRDEWVPRIGGPVVVSGVIGPRGDGYVAGDAGSVDDAAAYHAAQADALVAGGVRMLSAVTMTTSTEAAGIALAAARIEVPVAISFTVETDGALPSGESLADAVQRVDETAPVAYFAINCAHPSHFAAVLDRAGPWASRIRAVRANASTKSHAELDASAELDIGDPDDLARRYRGLRGVLPGLNVLGGCCGTDWRHLRAIRDAWLADRPQLAPVMGDR